jgi:hypothetical protein
MTSPHDPPPVISWLIVGLLTILVILSLIEVLT